MNNFSSIKQVESKVHLNFKILAFLQPILTRTMHISALVEKQVR